MNINAIIAQYDLQTSWFLNALEGISDEESKVAFSENLNPIQWVAGHLTDARITINSIISGGAINEDYKKLFGKGTSNKVEASSVTIDQIKTDWTHISEKLKDSLRNLSDERLLSKPPFQTSISDQTLLGLIAYFAIHEGFHIGQLSVSRKLNGKPAMNMGMRQKVL